jgi:hypothetical protein
MALADGFGWVWPSISDSHSAVKVSRLGFYASVWRAGAAFLFAVLKLFEVGSASIDIGALVDILLFIIIGWGIYGLSRIAAVAGLLLYVFERIVMWAEAGTATWVTVMFLTFMFISGVRGVFAYHKYANAAKSEDPAETPTI